MFGYSALKVSYTAFCFYKSATLLSYKNKSYTAIYKLLMAIKLQSIVQHAYIIRRTSRIIQYLPF